MSLVKYVQQPDVAQSRSRFWLVHQVWIGGIVDDETGERIFYACCTCEGYRFRGSCAHADEAMLNAPKMKWEIE